MPAKKRTVEPVHETREQWLNALVDLFRPVFVTAGSPLPDKVRISIGFPGARGKGHVLGSCWAAECSEDGAREIFISPTAIGSPIEIAGIAVHEMVHAAIPYKKGNSHGKDFKALGEAVGLEGKPTQMCNGESFSLMYSKQIYELGPFPGKMLSPLTSTGSGSGNKKRKLKVECDECGCTFRIAEKWVNEKNLRCIDADCNGSIEQSDKESE